MKIPQIYWVKPPPYAWIFLSVPDKPGSLRDVIARADGLNHAVPSPEDLRLSFGWLLHHGLIRKDGTKYSMTPAGIALRNRCAQQTFSATCNAVRVHFATLSSDDFEPDDISSEEWATAYSKYMLWFRVGLAGIILFFCGGGGGLIWGLWRLIKK